MIKRIVLFLVMGILVFTAFIIYIFNDNDDGFLGKEAIFDDVFENHLPIALDDGELLTYTGRDKGISDIEKEKTIIEEGNNFRIFMVNENDESSVPILSYEVFNNEGEILRSGTGWRIPSFNKISGDILEIAIGTGTGLQMVQFYSVKLNILSEVFHTPIVISDELIALLGWDEAFEFVYLTIRHIFDTEIYYNEFVLKHFSQVANPIDALISIKIYDEEIEIIYLSGECFDEKVVILFIDYKY